MMKKLLALIGALCLLLGCAALAEEWTGKAIPDFTVSTTDGGVLTLSELLAEKQLVVLNLFASWCPPCEREFPEMEKVYEKLSDQMEIVALSAFDGDTMEVISDYKASHGLTFPMGLTGGALDFIELYAYPTTLFIDREGNVGYAQVGSFVTAASFEAVAEAFLGDDYTSRTVAMYGVYAEDQDGYLVPDVYVNLCTDTVCEPLRTDETGSATLVTDEIADYHVQILKVPDDYSFDPDFEAYTGTESGWTGVRVTREDGD